MRHLDWITVLTDHRVPFVERGANVKRGEINIQCPFCGSADPSHHMGLNLETGWWACWRNNTHRGKSPVRLLVKLLNIPFWKAAEIAGIGKDYVDPDGFDAVAARVMGRNKEVERPEQVQRQALRFPRTFQPLENRGASRRHWRYLADQRKFGDYTDEMCELYSLHIDRGDDWLDRVVIPYYLEQALVTWTGRAIARSTIRYKDLPVEESLVPPKETLFNHDAIIEGGDTLVIVEGPLDALKIDYFGRWRGVRAVALSTNSVSDEQSYLLEGAVGRFKKITAMLDNATTLGIVDSMRLKQQLCFIPGLSITAVPFGLKDAGEMCPVQATEFARTIRT